MSALMAPGPVGVRLGSALVTVAFLGAVVGGVGAPLITSVAIDLDVPLEDAQWALTVTLFSGAISAPVLGRLGTGPHRRTTILSALALVALGGLLTTIPLPYWVLLVGRAFQGLGLGAVALLMSVARDHLPTDRAQSTIATISVASTVGIGVAYPTMGLVDQLAGLRMAYGLGFVLTLAAVVVAWRAIPKDVAGHSPRVDVPGAVLLGIGTLGVLLVVAQPAVWGSPWVGVCVLVLAAVALVGWLQLERRTPDPLVNLGLLMKGGVFRANLAMFVAGIGMYLLFSLLTRYVQTPSDAGYGFGLSGAVAGAALIPFSVLGFVAGRLSPRLAERLSPPGTFAIYAGFVIAAACVFALIPGSLAVVLIAMTLLGFGVGGASAIMPRLVLNGIPATETASVLSINQIVRTVGFSMGSALAGLLLATATPNGALLPREHGYTTAAIYVLPLLAISVVVIVGREVAQAGDRG